MFFQSACRSVPMEDSAAIACLR